MVEVRNPQCHDRHHRSGMFLIFRDAFAVGVAFSVPDFAVAEVIAFDILFVEVDGRDSFDGKDGGIRAARL